MAAAGATEVTETIVVESPKAVTTETVVRQESGTTPPVIEASFTPSRAAEGLSKEVFGTVAVVETCYGAVENLDGTRVQHVHDRAVYRLLEEILAELREQRGTRNSEKGD